MEKGPRKATDVLLDLESKIDNLVHIIRSQDLNIKLLSNKLNLIIEKLEGSKDDSKKITVEAVNSLPLNNNSFIPEEKNIPVSSDFNLSLESNPQGFRRTSRPETYSGDDMYLKKEEKTFPVQVPELPEVVVNNNIKSKPEAVKPTPISNTEDENVSTANSVPVVQRVVDKNGKSVFLADVEVNDLNGKSISKTRTNGTGKWMVPLAIGTYKVIIRKRESLTKEKLESIQSVTVDGKKSPLELQTLIIK